MAVYEWKENIIEEDTQKVKIKQGLKISVTHRISHMFFNSSGHFSGL